VIRLKQSDPMPDANALSAPPPRPWLRRELVPSWTEFVVVAALVMALPIRNSTVAALHGSSGRFMQLFMADTRLSWAIVLESVLLGLFLLYLHRRGWRPADLRVGLGWWTTLEGLGLFAVCFVATTVVLVAALWVMFKVENRFVYFSDFWASMAPHIARHSIHLSWPVIVVSMVLNAFLEEVVCMGYIFNQLAARRGPALALIVTVFVRVACHTYQDPAHLTGIAVLFTIYGLFYCRVWKLWPLIFAHLVLDIFSLSALKLAFG
jgi:membrane protease YdiL (CAAX protease family)